MILTLISPLEELYEYYAEYMYIYVKRLQLNIVLNFNSSKSILVTFNVHVDVSFMLNNKPIVKVDNAVHLGHRIGKDLNVKNISLGVSI